MSLQWRITRVYYSLPTMPCGAGGQKCHTTTWLGNCAIHHNLQTLCQQIITSFIPWITIFMGNLSPIRQTCGGYSWPSLGPRPRSFTARTLRSCRAFGKKCWIPIGITLKCFHFQGTQKFTSLNVLIYIKIVFSNFDTATTSTTKYYYLYI